MARRPHRIKLPTLRLTWSPCFGSPLGFDSNRRPAQYQSAAPFGYQECSLPLNTTASARAFVCLSGCTNVHEYTVLVEGSIEAQGDEVWHTEEGASVENQEYNVQLQILEQKK